MISLIENKNFTTFQNYNFDSLFCNISSQLYSYPDLCEVWQMCDDKSNLICIISRLFCNVTISFNVSNNEIFDCNELSEFVKVIGYSTLTFNYYDFTENFLSQFNSTYIKTCCMNLNRANYLNNTNTIVKDVTSTKEIYNLLVNAHEKFLNIQPCDETYVDINHRMRHNTLYIKGVYIENELISSAMTNYVDRIKKSIVIGGVYCKKEYRNNRYAKNCVSALIENYSDYAIYLYCDSSLIEYYKKIGFEKIHTTIII